jgi:death on curing protein
MPSYSSDCAVSDEPGLDYLSEDDLVEIAEVVIEGEVVISDPGLLVSAMDRPWLRALGHDAYPEFADRAAALMQSLARNGPLVSGNEELAWAATRVFCLLNGLDLICGAVEAERMILAVAHGEVDAPALADALRSRIR